MIRGPIRPEGKPFGKILALGYYDLQEQASTGAYIYNSTMQPSLGCFVIGWMINSPYGQYHL